LSRGERKNQKRRVLKGKGGEGEGGGKKKKRGRVCRLTR